MNPTESNLNTHNALESESTHHNNNESSILKVDHLYAGSYAPSYANSATSHMEQKVLQEEEEHEKAELLNKKNPLCSLPWTIGDNRYAMIMLQIIMLSVSGITLYFAFYQSPWVSRSNSSCPAPSFGPFIALDDGAKEIECSWTTMSSILHSIPAIIGALSSIIILVVSLVYGPKVAKFIDLVNKDISFPAEQRPEYFDVYNTTMFRITRKIVGWCGYLQFISFGIDLDSYLIGQEYIKSEDGLSSTGSASFQYLLFAIVPLAILLRISHGAMWQREYKWVLYAQQEIQGATVKGGIQNVDAVISRGNNNQQIGPQITEFAGTTIAPSHNDNRSQYNL